MIQIKLNGEPTQIDEKQPLSELLLKAFPSRPGLAVAVNRSVIPRSEHEKQMLKEGDEVEVVHAVGGG